MPRFVRFVAHAVQVQSEMTHLSTSTTATANAAPRITAIASRLMPLF